MPKCKICKKPFKPFSSLEQWCSPDCGYELAKRRTEAKIKSEVKIERKELKKRKDKLKSKSEWLAEAQAEFNKYVRLRDGKEPCISCGRYHDGQYHAGHYLTVGANPELRFHPFNNNKQCAPCNNHLSGNIAKYRPALINKVGLGAVEWLEGPHEAQHWSIEEIKEIKAYYKALTKQLRG